MRKPVFFMLPAALLALSCGAPAHAQNVPAAEQGLVRLKEGQTLLNVSATERKSVTQDTLIAHLRYEATNRDAKALQDEINGVMKKALARANAVTDVKSATDSYYVYPQETKNVIGRQWRGSQSLRLESQSADKLLELTGALQEMGMVLNNLSYSLSPEKAEEVKDSLMEAALDKLRARAGNAAKALGMAHTELVEISIDTADNMAPMPVMARALSSEAAYARMEAPSAQPGETEITLTVSARALLKP